MQKTIMIIKVYIQPKLERLERQCIEHNRSAAKRHRKEEEPHLLKEMEVKRAEKKMWVLETTRQVKLERIKRQYIEC